MAPDPTDGVPVVNWEVLTAQLAAPGQRLVAAGTASLTVFGEGGALVVPVTRRAVVSDRYAEHHARGWRRRVRAYRRIHECGA